jgi:hypothetical protein
MKHSLAVTAILSISIIVIGAVLIGWNVVTMVQTKTVNYPLISFSLIGLLFILLGVFYLVLSPDLNNLSFIIPNIQQSNDLLLKQFSNQITSEFQNLYMMQLEQIKTNVRSSSSPPSPKPQIIVPEVKKEEIQDVKQEELESEVNQYFENSEEEQKDDE